MEAPSGFHGAARNDVEVRKRHCKLSIVNIVRIGSNHNRCLPETAVAFCVAAEVVRKFSEVLAVEERVCIAAGHHNFLYVQSELIDQTPVSKTKPTVSWADSFSTHVFESRAAYRFMHLTAQFSLDDLPAISPTLIWCCVM
jgi:hypothetical protein